MKSIKKEVKRDIIAIVLVAVSLLLIACLIYGQKMGYIGGFLSRLLFTVTGSKGSFIIPAAVIMWVMAQFGDSSREFKLDGKALGFIVLAIAVLSLLHLNASPSPGEIMKVATRGDGSGLIGGGITYLLYKAFGLLGTRIILFTSLALSILLIGKISLAEIADAVKENGGKMFEQTKNAVKEVEKHRQSKTEAKEKRVRKKEFTVKKDKPVVISVMGQDAKDKIKKSEQQGQGKNEKPAVIAVSGEDTYNYPPLTMLTGTETTLDYDAEAIEDKKERLEKTLESFGIEAAVTKIAVGPTITRFEIEPAPGTKVSKITTLTDDIALNLAARDIRLEAPIPGKAAIGIEVPNDQQAIVYLRNVLENSEYQESGHPLAVAFGQDISGKVIVGNLSKMPHLLIAGATGSGKSVCINVIINSILFRASPDDVRFLMIDPKRVELSVYNKIPHLLAPVVTNPKKAPGALNWVVQEMEKRYNAFAETGARDLARYNAIVKKRKAEQEETEVNGDEQLEELPLIVVIIDELADLMMVASSEVEDSICRLAQMGRAAGIHLVVGTQRPSVDVITGLIKANIPTRIAFAVSSGVDSRTILDMNGAESLLGRGDMLFSPPGLSKPKRVQGAYIDDVEVAKVVDFVSRQLELQYEKEEFQSVSESGIPEIDDELDEYFEDAVRLVIERGEASASYLQRRLRVGWNRASRIIEQLHAQGVIGPHEGSKPREVYGNSERVQGILYGERQDPAN